MQRVGTPWSACWIWCALQPPGRNLPSDDDRLRSFGDKLLRAVLTPWAAWTSDPRTMLRAELPVLVQANMPQPASDAPVLTRPTAGTFRRGGSGGTVDSGATALDSPGQQDQQDQQDQGRAVLAISSGRSGTSQAATSAAATLPSTSASTSVSSPQRLSGGAPAPRASASLAPRVAVLHTHSSEAYRASQGSDYRWGKTDGVVRIGAVLAEELEKAGIKCVHSTKVHDYPDWTKSYAQSAATLRSILEKNPQIEAVIDVHRDSLPSGSESSGWPLWPGRRWPGSCSWWRQQPGEPSQLAEQLRLRPEGQRRWTR